MENIWLLIAYLIGSIPFTLVIGKIFKNIDIREHGSGNLGATNAIRVLGLKFGLPAGILDAFKAFIIVFLAQIQVINISYSPILLGIFVTLGHCYPLFAKFKGGKAVTPTLGTIFGFNFVIALISFVLTVITIKITKYVSLGSTVFAISIFLGMIFYQAEITDIFYILILTLLILYRHIPNYQRIFKGVEKKIK